MKKFFLIFVAIFLLFSVSFFAQEGELEFYLIDSYVTIEKPHKFKLMFFTSDSCTTKILFNNAKLFVISNSLKEEHKFELDLSGFVFDSAFVPFVLIAKDKNGKVFKSERFEVELPNDESLLQSESGGSVLNLCLGSVSLLLPSVGVYYSNRKTFNLALAKEIPFLSFGNIGKAYPSATLSVGYSHFFNAETKNYLSIIYKRIFKIPTLQYFAFGGGITTDFQGAYFFSPEFELGVLKLSEDYTLFLRYKFDFDFNCYCNKKNQFYLGLYAPFFSIN